MKKRVAVKITYECLVELLGLSDHKMLRLVNSEGCQFSETFYIVLEGPGGFDMPEGNLIPQALDVATIKERAANANQTPD